MSATTETHPRTETAVAAKKKILVIDDRPRDTQLVKLCLEMTNRYEVCEENDPFAAMATAEAFMPDLILLDVMMPGKDGGTLAAAFHNNPRLFNVPIVFLTALATREDVEGGSGHVGDYPFLSKPIIPAELVACLRHYLGR